MPNRKQNILYPAILLHQFIELQYPASLGIPAAFLQHLAIPEHIVGDNYSARTHFIKYQMIISGILPFISIYKNQIKHF